MSLELRDCQPLSARLSERACAANRKRGLFACGKCAGLGAAAAVPVPAEPVRQDVYRGNPKKSRKASARTVVKLVFVGDAARVVQAMQALVMVDGTGPLEELLVDAMKLQLDEAGVSV